MKSSAMVRIGAGLIVLGASLGAAPAFAQPVGLAGGASQGPQMSVEVRSDRADGRLTLHRLLAIGGRSWWTGRRQAVFQPLCTAPCVTTLAVGSHFLGVSLDGREAIPVRGSIDVQRALSLEVDYRDRRGLRTAGWITFAVGMAATLGLLLGGLVPFATQSDPDDGFVTAMLASSLGTVLLTGAISIPLVSFRDGATVRVVP
ncbi:MAG: hypothetical protein ACFCGT_20795 [Sandaracinaceae bacterium]